MEFIKTSSFRLLSELYSFLYTLFPFMIIILFTPVSVSYRSYILSYIPSIYILLIRLISFVSVSYRSYILSYLAEKWRDEQLKVLSFRLLSELYSFLYNSIVFSIALLQLVSVSYRSYILSYFKEMVEQISGREFPSPIGVIFFLICHSSKCRI